MVNVYSEIKIRCSKDVVAGYAADPDNAPEWYPNIRSVELKTEKPLRQGSQIAFVAGFLGKKLVYTYEFTEFIPGQKLVMRTAEGPFPMETTYTWTRVDGDTTRMTLRNTGQPNGFPALLAPFIAFMMKRANKKGLKKIKKILEGKNAG